MYRYKIELVTATDMKKFVDIASKVDGKVYLIDGTGFKVSGKSLLGAACTVEWSSLYCESEKNIYTEIERWCVD